MVWSIKVKIVHLTIFLLGLTSVFISGCDQTTVAKDPCTDTSCQEWELCNYDTGSCQLNNGRCIVEDDCPIGYGCNTSNMCEISLLCVSDSDCNDPAKPLCDGYECYAECNDSSNCTDGDAPICSFGKCVTESFSCDNGEIIELMEVSFYHYIESRSYALSGDDKYLVPSISYKNGFDAAVELLIEGDYCGAQAMAVISDMEIFKIIDTDIPYTSEFSNEYYCMEGKVEALDTEDDPSVFRGVYCVRNYLESNTYTRNVHMSIPHPKFDKFTNIQGAEVFQDSDARYFSLATAHRNSSSIDSTCGSGYQISDMAHNIDSLFHVFTQNISNLDAETYHIQLHGYGAEPVALVSLGSYSNFNADTPIRVFSANLQTSIGNYVTTHSVVNPGNVMCCNDDGDDGLHPDYCATGNMQGRYINQSHSATCTESPTSFIESRFIHIEQTRWLRGWDLYDTSSADYVTPKHSIITDAVNMTFELLIFK
jgi:hypothetical protein